MNIIIPMAGMGKRMRPHTITTPKPLVPIAGKPMVHRIVEDIANTTDQKIEEIAFIIHPSFGKVAEENLLAVAQKFGAQGKICYQETPLGTAHAILCAAESLKGNVFLAFADTLFKATFHIDTNKDAIIWTQQVADPSAFGVVKLDDKGLINAFVEKPETFVSDLAIIGVYYFKDGENLRQELQYLIDHDIKIKGEYQITDAMENMMKKGLQFHVGQVEEWLDCGNKDATLYTLERMLEIKKDTEQLVSKQATLDNATIIHPCFIADGVRVKNAVVGPYVSLEKNCVIENAVISHSIIGENSYVKHSVMKNSLLGNHVSCQSKQDEWSLGDYSFTQ
ncbi:MAG: sugar phosphate nucleotidyltransferase [Chitinophagaceae bacterium]